MKSIDPTYSVIQENKNGQILIKFKYENKEYLYRYEQGEIPNFDEIKKNSILVEDFKIIYEIIKKEKLNDLEKIEYQDYNEIKETLERINEINEVFKDYLKYNNNKPYTIKDIKKDEKKRALCIEIKVKDSKTKDKGVKFFIFGRDNKILGKIGKDIKGRLNFILLIETFIPKGLKSIWIDKGREGIGYFEYNEQIRSYDWQENIKNIDMIDVEWIKQDEAGNGLINFKYKEEDDDDQEKDQDKDKDKDKEYVYYYDSKTKLNISEIEQESVQLEYFKVIWNITQYKKFDKVFIDKKTTKFDPYVTNKDSLKAKETLGIIEKVNNVINGINGINKVFKGYLNFNDNKPYTIKDIKQDENGGA